MKATRIARAIAVAAVGALTVTGVSTLAVNPASAALRSTVVVVSSNAMTSLNPGTPDTNLTINSDIAYVTGMGFNYYNDQRNLVTNKVLGSYKIVKNTASDFRVAYTINAGRVWSDGTPITGVDLLLSHVLSSGAYSKAAGLGDPSNPDVAPLFNSGGYGGPYDSHVVGLPTLSADKMTVTVRYDAFQPDWQIMGPGVAPVHALELMADGKKSLQSDEANLAAKAAFLEDFTTKNSDNLKKIADIWSNDYNIATIKSSTNPLLLVSNGAFIVQSAVAGQSTTLVLNDKYNSGPKTSGIKKIVFKYIDDPTAAAQALQNHEIDIFQGQADASSVAQLKAMRDVTVTGGTNACFEHVDLRQGAGPGTKSDYTGPFAKSKNAAKDQKARDLRTAFLLAYPRQEIVDKLVKPINSKAVVINSAFLLPGQTGYDEIVAKSGISKFTAGTQKARTAAALALVKKHYPTASASKSVVNIKMLWGSLANTRRAAEYQLVIAAEAKAGFNVTNPNYPGSWGAELDNNDFDVAFFAWCPTAVSQTGSNANFQSDGSNNHLGFADKVVDRATHKLETKLTDAEITAQYLVVEKKIVSEAVTLSIFQHPAVTAFTATLNGVKPAPLSPNLVWNFWQWHF